MSALSRCLRIFWESRSAIIVYAMASTPEHQRRAQ
jgi:hypothetical protein